MMVFAIIGTIVAIVFSMFILFANGMRSSPGAFEDGGLIVSAWAFVAVLWLGWYIG